MAFTDSLDAFREIPYPGEWRHQGKCRNVTHINFFPKKGENSRLAQYFCRDCPVIKECLQYGLDNPVIQGVWGGLGQTQRRRLPLTLRDVS